MAPVTRLCRSIIRNGCWKHCRKHAGQNRSLWKGWDTTTSIRRSDHDLWSTSASSWTTMWFRLHNTAETIAMSSMKLGKMKRSKSRQDQKQNQHQRKDGQREDKWQQKRQQKAKDEDNKNYESNNNEFKDTNTKHQGEWKHGMNNNSREDDNRSHNKIDRIERVLPLSVHCTKLKSSTDAAKKHALPNSCTAHAHGSEREKISSPTMGAQRDPFAWWIVSSVSNTMSYASWSAVEVSARRNIERHTHIHT